MHWRYNMRWCSTLSQFSKLPTHQQIAVLGQVVGMAEGDPATSKAVLEPAERQTGVDV